MIIVIHLAVHKYINFVRYITCLRSSHETIVFSQSEKTLTLHKESSVQTRLNADIASGVHTHTHIHTHACCMTNDDEKSLRGFN